MHFYFVRKSISRAIALSIGLAVSGTAAALPDYMSEEHSFTFGDGTTRAMALHDFDGDGNLDLVTANAGVNKLWYGIGNGDFGSPLDLSDTAADGTTIDVSVADFTGDGKADALFINADATEHLYVNAGNGTLVWNGQAPELSDSECQAANLNEAESTLDLICANDHSSANPGTRLWLNNGDGTFTAASSDVTTEGPANTLATGDFNGDGSLDVILGMGPDTTTGYNGENVIWLGDGAGNLAESTDQQDTLIIEKTDWNSNTELYPNTVAFSVKDTDDDGTVDEIVEIANTDAGTYTGALKAWERNEHTNNFFATYAITTQGDAFRELVTADLDNDGEIEMITADEKNLTIHYSGGSEGIWISPKTVAVGDLDNDGDIDVVIATEQSDSIGLGEPEIAVRLNTTVPNGNTGSTSDGSTDSSDSSDSNDSNDSTDSDSSGGGAINPLWALVVCGAIVAGRRRYSALRER